MVTKVGHYRQYINDYGWIAVLKVCHIFEQREKYEECVKIMKAIKEYSRLTGEMIPDRFSEDIIDLAYEVYKYEGYEKDGLIKLINQNVRLMLSKISA